MGKIIDRVRAREELRALRAEQRASLEGARMHRYARDFEETAYAYMRTGEVWGPCAAELQAAIDRAAWDRRRHLRSRGKDMVRMLFFGWVFAMFCLVIWGAL